MPNLYDFYKRVPFNQRPRYAIAVGRLAQSSLKDGDPAVLVRKALDRAEAWCNGAKVDAMELADFIHDVEDNGLDLLSQAAHAGDLPIAPAIDAVIYAVAYVAWKVNLLNPPVMELLDNACEEMLGEMEKFVCLSSGIQKEHVLKIAEGLCT